jgi:acetyl-CoA acyltransferase
VHPVDLSAHVLEALATRSGIDPAVVDDVVWGCVSQVGEQTFDIARNAVLAAGWPETVTGVTLDRQCGSSQQSVHFAAAGLVAGHYDAVVAGGVESMSRVPMGSSLGGADPFGSRFAARYDGARPNQGVGAEMMAERWGFSRTQVDEYAVGSHEKAAAARADGRFTGQVAPVTTADGVVSEDEGIRAGSTVASLAGLKTVFKPDGVITAGNASQISDGAAALLIASEEAVHRHNLTPRARIHALAVTGADPVFMLTGPIPATGQALSRAKLEIDEIDVFEVNEAFAPVLIAWSRDTGASLARTNSTGGAIALGHPLGATGAILMTKLVHELERTGGRYGLQTMCEGGGQANATIIERVA